jgi:hypothetical protein
LGKEAPCGIWRVIAWNELQAPRNPASLIRGFELSEPPTQVLPQDKGNP